MRNHRCYRRAWAAVVMAVSVVWLGPEVLGAPHGRVPGRERGDRPVRRGVSREDFRGPDRVFDDMDANGDGYISREERESFLEERSEADRLAPAGNEATPYPSLQVLKYDKEKAFPGNVIFVDKLCNRVVEAALDGEIVWECCAPRKQVGRSMLETCGSRLTDVELMPNDHLLVLVGGAGVYEIDKTGEVYWSYENDTISHDADCLPNGNVLLACVGAEAESEFPYEDPQAIEVNRAGEIVWEWHAKDEYADSKYRDVRSGDADDWTHMNSVQRLDDGSTLLSVRNWNLLLAVDEDGNTVWKTGADEVPPQGRFSMEPPSCPHTPVILDNGNIIISESVRGRVIEWDPEAERVVWAFPEGDERREDWYFIRAAHRLPNGNTFIIDSRGQFLEVTEVGEIVWQARIENFQDLRQGEDKNIPQKSPCFNADRRGLAFYGGR